MRYFVGSAVLEEGSLSNSGSDILVSKRKHKSRSRDSIHAMVEFLFPRSARPRALNDMIRRVGNGGRFGGIGRWVVSGEKGSGGMVCGASVDWVIDMIWEWREMGLGWDQSRLRRVIGLSVGGRYWLCGQSCEMLEVFPR